MALAFCFCRFTSVVRVSRLLCDVIIPIIIQLAETNVFGPPHSHEICSVVSHGTVDSDSKGMRTEDVSRSSAETERTFDTADTVPASRVGITCY